MRVHVRLLAASQLSRKAIRLARLLAESSFVHKLLAVYTLIMYVPGARACLYKQRCTMQRASQQLVR